MSDGEEERQVTSSAERAPRLKVCRCGRICRDYPRCRHPERHTGRRTKSPAYRTKAG